MNVWHSSLSPPRTYNLPFSPTFCVPGKVCNAATMSPHELPDITTSSASIVLKLSLLPKLYVLAVTTTSFIVVACSRIRIKRFCDSVVVSTASSKPINVALMDNSPVLLVTNSNLPSESVRHPSIVPIINTLAPAIGSRPSVTTPEITV